MASCYVVGYIICSLVQSLGWRRYLDPIGKLRCQVKAGMQAVRWEEERTRKRSGGESTNAFRMFENTSVR